MNALILSCNTGGGHNSAGDAVVEALADRGHMGERVDLLALAGEEVSQLVSGAYVGMVKEAPALFGLTYGLGRVVSSAEHILGLRSPVYLACAQLVPKLEEYLAEHPCDAVIAPHVFPAMALTEMKRKGMPLPLTLAVATDYTCIPLFQEEDCDYTLIPSALCADEFSLRGIPREKLIPIGIPVSGEFQRRIGRLESRRLLGLEEDGRWVLIMGGSMGAGSIAPLTRSMLRLTPEDVRLAVICGSNQALYRSMERRYAGCARVRLIGYTGQVARYMEACDLLYTKPGGITSTEGAAMGIPMVPINPIPGGESRNRRVFTHNGMSVSGHGVLSQTVRGWRLLNDPKRREEMLRAQRRQVCADTAGQIVTFLEEHWRERAL